jgi:hypothetical protein
MYILPPRLNFIFILGVFYLIPIKKFAVDNPNTEVHLQISLNNVLLMVLLENKIHFISN